MDVHRLYRFLFSRFRAGRMARFKELFLTGAAPRVLDVGGAWFNWSLLEEPPEVVLSNLSAQEVPRSGEARYVVADGCALPFRDGAFAVVFSNSVIEHVGAPERQRQFAHECARVGRSYFVQTPNRRFPFEPHMLTPFFHWLPLGLQIRLARNFTLRGLLSRPSRRWCEAFLRTTRMLDPAELGELFPDARIVRERFLGLTKSLIAIKLPGAAGPP